VSGDAKGAGSRGAALGQSGTDHVARGGGSDLSVFSPHNVLPAELMRWAGRSASSGARSLENAVVVARTVLEDVDMDVVGMRFVGAWAKHGREPAATRHDFA
jgi:hypothetical protein